MALQAREVAPVTNPMRASQKVALSAIALFSVYYYGAAALFHLGLIEFIRGASGWWVVGPALAVVALVGWAFVDCIRRHP